MVLSQSYDLTEWITIEFVHGIATTTTMVAFILLSHYHMHNSISLVTEFIWLDTPPTAKLVINNDTNHHQDRTTQSTTLFN